MRKVCIVGAGPSGLVAARHLLLTGKLKVTIFEKHHRLGGIWAIDETTQDGFLHPETPVNLSRFTVGFSDLDWDSVDTARHSNVQNVRIGASEKHHTPMFPKAWQVYKYLQTYQKRYIPDDAIKYNHEVVSASRSTLASTGQPTWSIVTRHASATEEHHDFDYLLVGSGFFSAPRPIEKSVPDLPDGLSIPLIHSSEFRRLDQLISEKGGKNILMIGGGNSSGEAAASVAMQISDAQWSPRRSGKNARDLKVVHVVPRPVYALPPYNESDPENLTYMPLDFKLYNLSKRPPGPITGSFGPQSAERIDMVHEFMQGVLGDQSELSEALVSVKASGRSAAYAALSESYMEFVRSGAIHVERGRVVRMAQSDTGISAVVKNGSTESQVDNIAGVVNSTGFSPATALSFLTDDVKEALGYDAGNLRIPLLLEHGQTLNEKLPDIAFVGWYDGPFWPVMEQQARAIAARWVDGHMPPRNEQEAPERISEIRQLIAEKAPVVPQYWYADYVGHMEEAARHLCLTRNDGQFEEREGCPSPARYISRGTNREEADNIMQSLHQTWHDCVDHGKFVARAVFRALHGNWTIKRDIGSSDPNFSGTLKGQASFHPRLPTTDNSEKSFDLEYIYVESGEFTSASGLSMRASRRYVYRYSEADDKLSVWFVKPSNDLQVDYLFHDLKFTSPEEARRKSACVATADHLCVKDMYTTEYSFPMKAVSLPEFKIKHAVKGPQKDYVMTTTYSRPK